MKKRPPYNENAMIRGAVRRTFSRSPIVREVLTENRREIPKYNKDGTRAKKDSVQYKCGVCKSYVGSTQIAVDHIDPVIHPEHGFKTWDEFVKRLFCSKDNLQPICDPCHNEKTNKERFERTLIKDREILGQMSFNSNPDFIRNSLKKFTKKKLAAYPTDIVKKVEDFKTLVKAKFRK